jgi:hypothetical protein
MRFVRFVRSAAALAAFGASVAPLAACDSKRAANVHASANDCADCHMSDFRSVTRPPHLGVKPTKCAVCHTNYSWHPSRLDHPFALTGAHEKASCFSCHKGNPPVFEGTATECVACHRSDYDGSRFPGHARFPVTCADCHSTSAWKPPLPTFVPGVVHEPGVAGDAREPKAAPPSTANTPKGTPAPHARRPSPTPSTPRPLSVPTAPPPSPRPVSVPTTSPPLESPRPDSVSGASHHR